MLLLPVSKATEVSIQRDIITIFIIMDSSILRSGHLCIKDAECDESDEKSNFRFPDFYFLSCY